MRKTILSALTIGLLCFIACGSQPIPDSEAGTIQSNPEQTTKQMNTFVSIFEIPVTDMSRAINFYQSILGIAMEKFEMPGMQIGVFPSENQAVQGVLMKGEGYNPAADGVTLYLNGGTDLQNVLDKVEKSGGTILMPKTPHADESGFFALFMDTEGNRLGLHSMN